MDPHPMNVADLLEPDALYHLATSLELETYRSVGSIEPASLAIEGFVHCSWGHQVSGTVGRHFAEATDLLALCLDPDALGSVELVEEDSYGSGLAFPHVYGAIPFAAVLDAVLLR